MLRRKFSSIIGHVQSVRFSSLPRGPAVVSAVWAVNALSLQEGRGKRNRRTGGGNLPVHNETEESLGLAQRTQVRFRRLQYEGRAATCFGVPLTPRGGLGAVKTA